MQGRGVGGRSAPDLACGRRFKSGHQKVECFGVRGQVRLKLLTHPRKRQSDINEQQEYANYLSANTQILPQICI